jgi:hypothetical protein
MTDKISEIYETKTSRSGTAFREGRRTDGPSTKFADREAAITDPYAALEKQLQDGRYAAMRSEMSQEYIENLEIPNYGDNWIPGYKLVPVGLARELGLAVLEDGDPLEEIPIDEPTQEPIGAVDGNIIGTFVDGITGQHLYDVLNSALLAQLAANVKFDRESDPISWTKFYTRVLENVGWVVPEYSFFGLRSNEARFSMDAALIKVITAIMTPRQVDLVKDAVEALQALRPDDRRLTIFRRNSVEQKAGNFQVDSVGESANHIVSMKLCAFHFKTDETVTDVLWWRFKSSSTTLNATRTTLVLNDQVHDRLRQPILDKLGNRGKDFIAGLVIDEASPSTFKDA